MPVVGQQVHHQPAVADLAPQRVVGAYATRCPLVVRERHLPFHHQVGGIEQAEASQPARPRGQCNLGDATAQQVAAVQPLAVLVVDEEAGVHLGSQQPPVHGPAIEAARAPRPADEVAIAAAAGDRPHVIIHVERSLGLPAGLHAVDGGRGVGYVLGARDPQGRTVEVHAAGVVARGIAHRDTLDLIARGVDGQDETEAAIDIDRRDPPRRIHPRHALRVVGIEPQRQFADQLPTRRAGGCSNGVRNSRPGACVVVQHAA